MLISAREACEVLADVGVTSRAARRLLASGLAGVPTRTRAANLFEDERVRELARRPILSWRQVERMCPAGVFIARRDPSVATDREARLEVLADGWELSPWSWFAMGIQMDRCGSLPFVATVSGFVVLGADIVGLRGGSRLLFGPPGAWFTQFEGHRLPTGPGRPWVLHLGPLAPEKIAL